MDSLVQPRAFQSLQRGQLRRVDFRLLPHAGVWPRTIAVAVLLQLMHQGPQQKW